jgi:quinol monooxygenase YgiN
MRFLQLKINQHFVDIFQEFYEDTVIPELQKLPGCHFAELIQSKPKTDEFISLTFWENLEAAENYDKSGVFKELLQKSQPYMAESSEWKLQLSDSLELEYKPVPEEPVLKEYDVATQAEKPIQQNPGLHVRIVSVSIQEDKIDEFKRIYNEEILPALRKTKGCLYAFLTENLQIKNEFISITGWESKEDVDAYENGGQFALLVEKVRHTFSQVYQWKLSEISDESKKMITSEDLSVSYFHMVTGKDFLKR